MTTTRIRKLAAKVLIHNKLPSDLVDDYPQKTYAASKVAAMMKPAHSTMKDIAYELADIANELDGIKPMTAKEISQEEMITLMATFVSAFLISIEEQLPYHKRYAREIRKVEDAVVSLAKLVAKPLDKELIDLGVRGWNAALTTMQGEL